MFYERYTELCRKRGISPSRGLAELGLASGNLSNWKNGRLPKPEILNRIARYFEVSMDYLMGGDEDEKQLLKKVLWGEEAGLADNEMLEDLKDYAALLMEKKKRRNGGNF